MIDWLLAPAVGLSVLLALIYTIGVHLFLAVGYRRLLRDWFLAMLAMAAGSLLASRANSHLPTLGDAHIVEASALALMVLLAAGLKARSATPRPELASDA